MASTPEERFEATSKRLLNLSENVYATARRRAQEEGGMLVNLTEKERDKYLSFSSASVRKIANGVMILWLPVEDRAKYWESKDEKENLLEVAIAILKDRERREEVMGLMDPLLLMEVEAEVLFHMSSWEERAKYIEYYKVSVAETPEAGGDLEEAAKSNMNIQHSTYKHIIPVTLTLIMIGGNDAFAFQCGRQDSLFAELLLP